MVHIHASPAVGYNLCILLIIDIFMCFGFFFSELGEEQKGVTSHFSIWNKSL